MTVHFRSAQWVTFDIHRGKRRFVIASSLLNKQFLYLFNKLVKIKAFYDKRVSFIFPVSELRLVIKARMGYDWQHAFFLILRNKPRVSTRHLNIDYH